MKRLLTILGPIAVLAVFATFAFPQISTFPPNSFSAPLYASKFFSNSTLKPTCAFAGVTTSGTGAICTVTGSDQWFSVAVVTGTGISAVGTVATLTIGGVAAGTALRGGCTPSNNIAATPGGTFGNFYWSPSSTNQIIFTTYASQLALTTGYSWECWTGGN